MTTWYVYHKSNRVGPYSTKRLRTLVQRGILNKATCISRDGRRWLYAGEAEGLFSASVSDCGEARHEKTKIRGQRPTFLRAPLAPSAAETGDVGYFLALADEQNRNHLLQSTTFWMLVVLGVVPLLLGSITPQLQPTAFAIFFAMLWGAIFKSRVIPIQGRWRLLLCTFFFTGIAGLGILLFLSNLMHAAVYSVWTNAGSSIPSIQTWRGLIYMIMMVGFVEEFCKAIPVCALIWCSSKKKPSYPLIVLTGIFSGFGFAAFENIGYGEAAGAYFETAGNAGAWVTLRAMSLVFCHGIWSGTAAYLITIGLKKKQFLRYYLLGIISAGTIHGMYNWLTEVQLTVAGGLIACAWAILYANILNLKTDSVNKGPKHGKFS